MVRVSAHSWSPRVLRALQPVLAEHRPYAVALEWAPSASREALDSLLRWLAQHGWSVVTHSGPACQQRLSAAATGLSFRWEQPRPLDMSRMQAADECALAVGCTSAAVSSAGTELLYVTRPMYE